MILRVSHGADRAPDPVAWFVVEPLEGETCQSVLGTPITHAMAVSSLLNAGRAVYEVNLDDETVIRLANPARKPRKEERS